jgi:hypothetical protein
LAAAEAASAAFYYFSINAFFSSSFNALSPVSNNPNFCNSSI